jgi:hypothetical protein
MVENYTFYSTKTEILKPLPLLRGEVGEGFYISQSLMHSRYRNRFRNKLGDQLEICCQSNVLKSLQTM